MMKTLALTIALFGGFALSSSLLQAQGKDYHEQELNGKTFKQAALSGADFTDATLRGTDFTGATLKGAIFKGADLSNAVFDSADLTGAIFTEATAGEGRAVNFNYANLANANLEGMDMANAGYYRTKFRGANLKGTKGWGLLSDENDFSKADVRVANFRGMKLYQEESRFRVSAARSTMTTRAGRRGSIRRPPGRS